MPYSVYIVLCSDNSFYTGYAADVLKRIAVHNNGKTGAKYTKTRRPVHLVYAEDFETKSEAMKREYQIKQLTHDEKEQLTKNFNLEEFLKK